jgi:periplasmic protein TonB
VTVTTVDPYEPEHGREFMLWTAAALVVCAIHVGLAAAYLLLKPEPEARAEAPVIDVAFMPETQTPAPAVPPTQQSVDQPPSPDQPSADPPTEVRISSQAVVPEREPPPAKSETMVQPEPAPPPAVALAMPELPAEPKSPDQVAVLPPPAEKPAEVAPPPEKPLTSPPERSTRKPEKVEKETRKPPPPKAVASPGAKPARLASAPNPGQQSEGAETGRASWLSEFIAHMRSYNTYSASGSKESGTVRIGVTIDRNGRLLSHRVVGSSGSPTLDRAALDIVQRAQPFPRFPASMSQAQMVEVIPLHLHPQ